MNIINIIFNREYGTINFNNKYQLQGNKSIFATVTAWLQNYKPFLNIPELLIGY